MVVENYPLFVDVLDFLAQGPSPAEILAYRPSQAMQERMSDLVQKRHSDEGLTESETEEFEELARLNHFMTMLKIRTRQKLDEGRLLPNGR